MLLAEAIAKELPGIDATRALAALNASQESDSPNPYLFGRYPGWRDSGLLDTTVKNCASRCVEYAFHDHATAIVADAAGATEQAVALRKRADGLWDSWHDEYRCFAPREANGDFASFNPWKPSCRDFWNDPHFYEGTGHDYALGAWHVIPELVERHGGPAGFAAHLDTFIDACYKWKEINLHVPWLYHFCGMPHRSSQQLRRIMDARVHTGRLGFSDNEDMGAWSSWWLTGAMGLCPIPGSDRYLLGTPRFEQVTLPVGVDGNTVTIRCTSAPDGEQVITAARLNGTELDRAWLRHAELVDGAVIELELGQAGDWAATPIVWKQIENSSLKGKT